MTVLGVHAERSLPVEVHPHLFYGYTFLKGSDCDKEDSDDDFINNATNPDLRNRFSVSHFIGLLHLSFWCHTCNKSFELFTEKQIGDRCTCPLCKSRDTVSTSIDLPEG